METFTATEESWPMSCRLPITEGDLVKEAANNTGLLSAPEAASVSDSLGVAASLRLHWPEYLNGTIKTNHRNSQEFQRIGTRNMIDAS